MKSPQDNPNSFSRPGASQNPRPTDLRVAGIRPAYGASMRRAFASSRLDGSGAAVAEDFFGQLWTPGLLDRLQAPLTRFHE